MTLSLSESDEISLVPEEVTLRAVGWMAGDLETCSVVESGCRRV